MILAQSIELFMCLVCSKNDFSWFRGVIDLPVIFNLQKHSSVFDQLNKKVVHLRQLYTYTFKKNPSKSHRRWFGLSIHLLING